MTPSTAKNIAWAIARDDLRRDRLWRQAELLADMFLDARIDVGEGADGTRDRAGGYFCPGRDEAGAVAVHLCVESGERQAHRRRLGMDAVTAADADRVLVLEGAGLEGGKHAVHVGKQDIGGAHELDVEGRVEHVGLRSCPGARSGCPGRRIRQGASGTRWTSCLVTASISSMRATSNSAFPPFSQMVSAADFGMTPEVRQRVAGMRLDLEPDAELRFGRPDGDHVRSGIARDHRL